jgi:hypothetical protein
MIVEVAVCAVVCRWVLSLRVASLVRSGTPATLALEGLSRDRHTCTVQEALWFSRQDLIDDALCRHVAIIASVAPTSTFIRDAERHVAGPWSLVIIARGRNRTSASSQRLPAQLPVLRILSRRIRRSSSDITTEKRDSVAPSCFTAHNNALRHRHDALASAIHAHAAAVTAAGPTDAIHGIVT